MQALRRADLCPRCSGIPATITQTGKFAIEASTSVLFPQSSQTGTGHFDAPALRPQPFGFTDQTPNSSEAAVLPSGLCLDAAERPDLVWLLVQLAIRVVGEFRNPRWAGAFYAQSSSLRTYNGAPTVAIKITDWLSVGGGVQIQYAEPHLLFATGATASGTPNSGPAHRPWLDGRLDRRRDGDADAVDADRPGVSLGTQSGDRRKLRCRQRGFGSITTVKWPDSASLGVRQGITSI